MFMNFVVRWVFKKVGVIGGLFRMFELVLFFMVCGALLVVMYDLFVSAYFDVCVWRLSACEWVVSFDVVVYGCVDVRVECVVRVLGDVFELCRCVSRCF